VVLISAQALTVNQKNGGDTLAEKLISEGVFTEQQYEAVTKKEDGDQTEAGDKTEGSDKTEGTDKTEGSDKTEDSKNTFTLTYFGDEALHNYLMSLNPDEVTTGPSQGEMFDRYFYSADIWDELEAKIKKDYDVVLIMRPQYPWDVEATVCTFVQTIDDGAGKSREIRVYFKDEDGTTRRVIYYLRLEDDLQSRVDQGIVKFDPVTKELIIQKDS
jgi:hypothetical protein